MIPTREDIALYVSGNFDGDAAALEAAIAADPALTAILAEEEALELQLRDAAAAATFCPACDDLVRGERCNSCGVAIRPGGYTVERVLVSNAHGRMYVAHDADGTQVALKELAFVHPPSPAAVAAFEREAKFLRALSHPAIPRFLASFEEGQGVHIRYYLAQELVEGTPLDALDDTWYTEAEIVDIAKQVLVILDYLQSLSPMVIHRDIKPANLLRRADGGAIALVDFGAAHAHGTTAGVTTIGTFGYMPVEQLAGIVDATTDLYALGASLLHLLTRQEPWKLAQTKITVNVSAGLRAFLEKLTASDPAARFASAKEALAALENRDRLAPRRRPWASRGGRIALGAVAATALAASGAGVYHLTRSTPEPIKAAPDPRTAVDPFEQTSLQATVNIQIPPQRSATLFSDGIRIGIVSNGAVIPMRPGKQRLKLLADNGRTCEDEIQLIGGHTTTVECAFAQPPVLEPQPRLNNTTRFTKSFQDVSLHAVMVAFSDGCGLNIVVPDALQAKVSVDFKDVACDQALEVVLESQGLWYQYWPDSKIVRIAPRKEIDHEVEEAAIRKQVEDNADPLATSDDDSLPAGPTIDLDFKDAPLKDVLRIIAVQGGVTLVVPDYIGGKITIRMKGAPWQHALEAALSSHGLWYRYRANGKLLRIAPRKQLDKELEDAQLRSPRRP